MTRARGAPFLPKAQLQLTSPITHQPNIHFEKRKPKNKSHICKKMTLLSSHIRYIAHRKTDNIQKAPLTVARNLLACLSRVVNGIYMCVYPFELIVLDLNK